MTDAVITILYFARIAELTGVRSERFAAEGISSGHTLLQALKARHPALADVNNLRLAINQTHAPAGAAIAAGDEVAVFEPVTGG
ncbi:MAG: MoaD/ThiS family protein [Comamonadaceae bacterium]|nr:MAG: MoaD/ThiS family protein [Comamonadaceae bacterium]